MSNATAVTDQTFQSEVLDSPVPVLVDFWAPWCGPCRAVAPTIDAIAAEFAGKLKVVKINTDESMDVPVRYGVRSIPTIMLFKGGQQVESLMGNRPKADFVTMVQRHV
jgi:thioredoxin 1